jgi:hypothetical protein
MTSMIKPTRRVNPSEPAKVTHYACIVRPICPCEMFRQGRTGCVEVNAETYLVTYNAELPRQGEPIVYGYRFTKADGTRYDVTATSCECGDHTFRQRQCKHISAVRRMLADGDLAEITPMAPVVPMFEDP